MYCALCVEACPYEAIQAGGTWKDVTAGFGEMFRDKRALTEFAHDYLRDSNFTYPNGQRVPDDVIALIQSER
jgi:formate hydrogenlyase subunit 6/NADH:ubiquinone oxidoreductase subunit I